MRIMKAQSAILGLVIVFVILIFVAVFFISYSNKPKVAIPKVLKFKADNFLSIILNNNLYINDCTQGITLSQMLADCSNDDYNHQCDNNGKYSGLTYCSVAKNITSYELNQTFKKEGYHYVFKMSLNNNVFYKTNFSSCPYNYIEKHFAIPNANGEVINVYLDVCK